MTKQLVTLLPSRAQKRGKDLEKAEEREKILEKLSRCEEQAREQTLELGKNLLYKTSWLT